jgi:hypothetical protein
MDQSNRKLSPMEFLAQLKAGNKPSKHLGSSSAQALAELPLDFSDPQTGADAVAGEETAATAVATADPPESAAAETPPEQSSETPPAAQANAQLNELFERVNSLLGASSGNDDGPFRPKEPDSIQSTGLTIEEVEKLILKFLLARGSGSGRKLAQQVCLPFGIIDPLLKNLKTEQLVVFKGSATMGDYEYALTELGRERARRYVEECTYFGAAPVCLKDYLESMARQSIAKQSCTVDDLKEAFADLIISDTMLARLGPAINSGRGMFLFGEPGNGKTSIAERVTNCFGSTIWIPRALGIDGDIIRLFDPAVHELIEEGQSSEGIFNLSGVDARWVHIHRPTVVVGGELTMAELEVKQNTTTKICEAPLQLKSNCGTLVIDDFGRQRMPVAELLNRWIVPLEKRYDFLNLPSGKKIQVPFDQIIIFSTNLEPRDLVDGAFLRRIPYKIQVPDPTPEQFHKLCEILAPKMGFQYNKEAVDYLIEKHYQPINRPMRACQPRDLLLQVRNYCVFHCQPKVMTPEAFDFACENYFSVM